MEFRRRVGPLSRFKISPATSSIIKPIKSFRLPRPPTAETERCGSLRLSPGKREYISRN
jgi:hypothetical protein